MHRVRLTYELSGPRDDAGPLLQHPLLQLLAALHDTGSIGGAARRLGRSYRHVWGELKRWERELGQTLVVWAKGQAAELSPFGEKLLWAERRAQARLAPQIEALRSEIEQAFAVAFDRSAGVITMQASHDEALVLLREAALTQRQLHLDIAFTGSVDALAALNEGRCLLAGFHALTASPQRSPTAKVYRAMLKPGQHKLVSFAQRTQGLIVPAGNPLGLNTLRDLLRPGLRFAQRVRGTGTRVVFEELLAQERIAPEAIAALPHEEASHRSAAETVASGAADVAFGIEAVARDRGIGFVPLAKEHYFIVGLQPALDHPHVRSLLALLHEPAWQTQLAALPGYDVQGSGEVLSLRRVLPWWSYRKVKAPSP